MKTKLLFLLSAFCFPLFIQAQTALVVNPTGHGQYNGTKPTQGQAFYGATPIVQPSASAQAAISGTLTPLVSGTALVSGSDYNLAVTKVNSLTVLVNQLRADLVNLGLIKGGP